MVAFPWFLQVKRVSIHLVISLHAAKAPKLIFCISHVLLVYQVEVAMTITTKPHLEDRGGIVQSIHQVSIKGINNGCNSITTTVQVARGSVSEAALTHCTPYRTMS